MNVCWFVDVFVFVRRFCSFLVFYSSSLLLFNSAHCQIHANCERQQTDRDIMDAPKQIERWKMSTYLWSSFVPLSCSLSISNLSSSHWHFMLCPYAVKSVNIERFVFLMYNRSHDGFAIELMLNYSQILVVCCVVLSVLHIYTHTHIQPIDVCMRYIGESYLQLIDLTH